MPPPPTPPQPPPPAAATVVVLPRHGDTGLGSKIEFCNRHVCAGQFEEKLAAHGACVLYSDCQTLSGLVDFIARLNDGQNKIFVGGFGHGASLACTLAHTPIDRVDLACFALDPPVETRSSAAALRHRLCLCSTQSVEMRGADFYLVDDGDISRQVEIAVDWITDSLRHVPSSPGTTQPERRRESTEQGGVTWRIERLDPENDGNVRAIFFVPVGCEELLRRFPVICCGSSFALETRGTGQVTTTFFSPTPNKTAEAIAVRIARRFDDPDADGARACPVS